MKTTAFFIVMILILCIRSPAIFIRSIISSFALLLLVTFELITTKPPELRYQSLHVLLLRFIVLTLYLSFQYLLSDRSLDLRRVYLPHQLSDL